MTLPQNNSNPFNEATKLNKNSNSNDNSLVQVSLEKPAGYWSEVLGNAVTGPLIGGLGGAAVGGALGGSGVGERLGVGKTQGSAIGASAGFYLPLLAATLNAVRTPTRSTEEQKKENKNKLSILKNVFIPGHATYNLSKRVGHYIHNPEYAADNALHRLVHKNRNNNKEKGEGKQEKKSSDFNSYNYNPFDEATKLNKNSNVNDNRSSLGLARAVLRRCNQEKSSADENRTKEHVLPQPPKPPEIESDPADYTTARDLLSSPYTSSGLGALLGGILGVHTGEDKNVLRNALLGLVGGGAAGYGANKLVRYAQREKSSADESPATVGGQELSFGITNSDVNNVTSSPYFAPGVGAGLGGILGSLVGGDKDKLRNILLGLAGGGAAGYGVDRLRDYMRAGQDQRGPGYSPEKTTVPDVTNVGQEQAEQLAPSRPDYRQGPVTPSVSNAAPSSLREGGYPGQQGQGQAADYEAMMRQLFPDYSPRF